jgi:hypothetical protein
MRYKFRSLPPAVLIAALLLPGASAEEKAQAAKKPPATPLVRTDLLGRPLPEPAAAIRDIFSPGRAVAVPEAAAPALAGSPEEAEPGPEGEPEAAPGEPALDVAYIGYVKSGGKMVALVFSDGLALAVAEGEEVFPGLKVERIAPDRIDVIGSDGKRTSVPIQGEQP